MRCARAQPAHATARSEVADGLVVMEALTAEVADESANNGGAKWLVKPGSAANEPIGYASPG